MEFNPNLRHWKKPRKPRRLLWLVSAALVLLLSIAAMILSRPPEKAELPPSPSTYGELTVHTGDDVTSVSVTLRNGDSWTAVRTSANNFVLQDDPDFRISESKVTSLTRAAAVISYDDQLTDDPSVYENRLDEFGLDEPLVTAHFTYTDGTEQGIRIGNRSSMPDETWYYLLVDGDPRLFTLDSGTVEDLAVERIRLHPVEQPVIHKARMDQITLTGESGTIQAAWELKGSITDEDSALNWQLTAPYVYPADSEAMSNLRTNLSNLRLGAYIAAATDENKADYGLDAPRMTIRIHMAPGMTNVTDENGSVSPYEWEESEVEIVIGGSKSDMVDYVLFNGDIFLTSHYSMQVFLETDWAATVSRYPADIAADQLSSLTINNDVYLLSREARLNEDNVIEYDDNGNAVYDTFVTLNGQDFPADAFLAAYERLRVVTVSGTLPADFVLQGEPHTTFIFRTVYGRTRTVQLFPYDALHDAVAVDGCAVFYLIHNGMTWDVFPLPDNESSPTKGAGNS